MVSLLLLRQYEVGQAITAIFGIILRSLLRAGLKVKNLKVQIKDKSIKSIKSIKAFKSA